MLKRLAIFTVFSGILINFSCVSVKKRPLRLYNDILKNHKTYDAIIVPGVPFENGVWSDVMKTRVLWSVYLVNKGIAKNVIYSGSAVYSPYFESKIMGLYAEELGVPKENIYFDTLAEHSTENVYYSYELATEIGFKSIALATDPFQSSLLKRFTRKRFKSPIDHIPILYDSLPALKETPKINPESAFKENFVPLTEKQGSWKRFKGTLGKYIPWKTDDKKGAEL